MLSTNEVMQFNLKKNARGRRRCPVDELGSGALATEPLRRLSHGRGMDLGSGGLWVRGSLSRSAPNRACCLCEHCRVLSAALVRCARSVTVCRRSVSVCAAWDLLGGRARDSLGY